MKKILFTCTAIALIAFTACNSSNDKPKEGNDMKKMDKDTSRLVTTGDNKDVKAIAITYTNADAKASASIKEIVDHYLHVKNALANDNGNEAARASGEMSDAIKKVDKSFFTSEQKKFYDNIEDDLKEHAEHIGKNAGNIKHQREHFAMMSEDVYDLVKAFGGGQPIYHDHCPMYNDGKGAIWLSEMKEVKNPYYGKEMPGCGTVEEVIK
jgi:Protein of unknown function (DUF3347)